MRYILANGNCNNRINSLYSKRKVINARKSVLGQSDVTNVTVRKMLCYHVFLFSHNLLCNYFILLLYLTFVKQHPKQCHDITMCNLYMSYHLLRKYHVGTWSNKFSGFWRCKYTTGKQNVKLMKFTGTIFWNKK